MDRILGKLTNLHIEVHYSTNEYIKTTFFIGKLLEKGICNSPQSVWSQFIIIWSIPRYDRKLTITETYYHINNP